MARSETHEHETVDQIQSRIPTFRTIEEEAEFWDTHDTTDFEDEFEEVTDIVFGSVQSKDQLVLRIMGDDLAALVERAQAEGVSPAELARGRILERLKESPSADASTQPAR